MEQISKEQNTEEKENRDNLHKIIRTYFWKLEEFFRVLGEGKITKEERKKFNQTLEEFFNKRKESLKNENLYEIFWNLVYMFWEENLLKLLEDEKNYLDLPENILQEFQVFISTYWKEKFSRLMERKLQEMVKWVHTYYFDETKGEWEKPDGISHMFLDDQTYNINNGFKLVKGLKYIGLTPKEEGYIKKLEWILRKICISDTKEKQSTHDVDFLRFMKKLWKAKFIRLFSEERKYDFRILFDEHDNYTIDLINSEPLSK